MYLNISILKNHLSRQNNEKSLEKKKIIFQQKLNAANQKPP